MSPPAHAAGLARRLASLFYDALLLLAVLMAGALPVTVLSHDAAGLAARPLFQLYLIALAGTYFVWQWRHGGQTLAMKAWRIRIVSRNGAPPGLRQALHRFVLALAGTVVLGAGFLWALVDRERQFLHDRLAGTRIIVNDE